MMKRRTAARAPSVESIESALLTLEVTGVLSREIVSIPIPLDGETSRPIPPRLFYFPRYHILVHAPGDPSFHRKNPGYVQYEASKEVHVLDRVPVALDNYWANAPTYRACGVETPLADPLSLAVRRAETKALSLTGR